MKKWALVTGATAGIGESFTRLLAAEGFNLVLVARDEVRLHERAQGLKDKYGADSVVIVADLATESGCTKVEEYLANNEVEVLINNFKKMGVNPNYIDIVCGIENGIIPENWRKLMTHYNSVRFFFYNDTRIDKGYQPSIYFNLMKQHIVARPEIQNDVLFLHDSTIRIR